MICNGCGAPRTPGRLCEYCYISPPKNEEALKQVLLEEHAERITGDGEPYFALRAAIGIALLLSPIYVGYLFVSRPRIPESITLGAQIGDKIVWDKKVEQIDKNPLFIYGGNDSRLSYSATYVTGDEWQKMKKEINALCGLTKCALSNKHFRSTSSGSSTTRARARPVQ